MPILEAAPERRTRSDRRKPAEQPVIDDLLGALGRGEIEILFQPQFAAADGTLVGAEALARWQHPERGRIGAEELFAIAARAGLVERLSRHVARAALVTAGNWPVPLRLSLNVTAADVAAGDFAGNLALAVEEAGFPPEHLTIEITEQVLLTDLDRIAERLRRLAELGICIALDDFGAGFCNFHYLKRLPIHALKLDRSMIEGVAEGIEREEQRAAIAREGCGAWQGFFGARPMTGPEFAALVRR